MKTFLNTLRAAVMVAGFVAFVFAALAPAEAQDWTSAVGAGGDVQ